MPPWITEGVLLGFMAMVGAIVTAYLAYLGVRTKSDRERVAAMETRLDTTEKRNIGLWAYCRALIDHIYKGGGPPPPDPPHQIMDLFD